MTDTDTDTISGHVISDYAAAGRAEAHAHNAAQLAYESRDDS